MSFCLVYSVSWTTWKQLARKRIKLNRQKSGRSGRNSRSFFELRFSRCIACLVCRGGQLKRILCPLIGVLLRLMSQRQGEPLQRLVRHLDGGTKKGHLPQQMPLLSYPIHTMKKIKTQALPMQRLLHVPILDFHSFHLRPEGCIVLAIPPNIQNLP